MRDDITLYFAHHEKLCLIDGAIAFMGGLDLCFGRVCSHFIFKSRCLLTDEQWDTNEHPIADAHPSDLNSIVYPGQDYNNARFMDFQHVDKWEQNAVSRLEISRMGWSDVALSLIGPAVEDLKLHFVQRWNFIYDEKYDARGVARYTRLDESMYKGGQGYHRRYLKEKVKHAARGYDDEGGYGSAGGRDYDNQPGPEGVRCQICRSVSKWSHGTSETEHSIANAYIEIISAAKHFVYMENQFFITATDPKQRPILNMIGRAIVDRIIRAAREGERFRIVVLMPAVPAFAGDLQDESALGTRAIMEFQYRS
jgi:phospholipase D1/2